MFGTKDVGTIVKVFSKAIADLKDRAEDMKEKIRTEQEVIDNAQARQQEYATEGVRAESIAAKLEGIIG